MKPVIVKPFPYGRNESIAMHGVGALTCGHGDGALTRGYSVGRAIAPHDCAGPQSLRFAEGCHRGHQGWALATCGMRLIGEMSDLHPRDGECSTMYGTQRSSAGADCDACGRGIRRRCPSPPGRSRAYTGNEEVLSVSLHVPPCGSIT